MRLKKLEITGFKSFQGKTRINFPAGISAIVGPNGCGKSNVVDALRWVMGEQSVKQLRGKSMDDVIFSGADNKQPLNMAEVSLLVENTNGTAPEELNAFTDIMVTRRIYRSGETGYFINRQPCRLKDIHNLFLGSGSGKNSFAVIQQGNIGALTDATPEERRYYIEDAADITKFKSRKKETLRKIETTKENLLRITDIVSEIKRQIDGLNRQATKARKYKDYREQAKKLDITIALWYFEDYSEKIHETSKQLTGLKDHEALKLTEISGLEKTTEEIRLGSLKKKQAIDDLTGRTFNLRREIDKAENDLSHLRQNRERLEREISDHDLLITDLVKRNSDIRIEIQELWDKNSDLDEQIRSTEETLSAETAEYDVIRHSLSELESRMTILNQKHMELSASEARHNQLLENSLKREDDIARRLKLIDEEVVTSEKKVTESRSKKKTAVLHLEEQALIIRDLREEISSISTDINEKKTQIASHSEDIRTLEIDYNKTLSQFTTLKSMHDNFEWYNDGVRAVLKEFSDRPENDSPHSFTAKGVLADILTVEEGYEQAVEAVAGEALQCILVNTLSEGADIVRYLKKTAKGTAGIIPLKELSHHSVNIPDHCDRLIDHITFDQKSEMAVRELFNNSVVVDTIDHALALARENHEGITIVTQTGDMILPSGIISGGSGDSTSSVLIQKQTLNQLESDIKTYESRLQESKNKLIDLSNDCSSQEDIHARLAEDYSEAEKERTDIERSLFIAEEEEKHSVSRFEIVSLEQEQLSGEQYDIDDELSDYRKKLSEITETIRTHEELISSTASEIKQLNEALETFNSQTVELRLKITSLNGKRETHANSLKQLNQFLDEGETRLRETEAGIKEKTDGKSEIERRIETYSTQLQTSYSNLTSMETESENLTADHASIEARLLANENTVEQEKKTLSQTSVEIKDTEIRLSELRMKRETITQRIEEKYHHKINQYQLQFSETGDDSIDLESVNIWVLESELEELNQRIKKLGNVNLGAISEYEELKARYEFMIQQQEDLEKTLSDLEKIIRKINKVSQERFINTFHEINEKLGELFPKLFEGGNATLVLTDPSSPLETGVELMIQPPGKKLTRLSLLSGGEKALSAIAFIFSIFLIKPSSFCIMDEIDAPLDDANVMRFNNLLKVIGENSQILVITHNKLTMEFADILFGVTMEKRGISKVVSVTLTGDDSSEDTQHTAVA